ncbi:hypothetical protein [Photorhabdus heterorhabditis]|uniref:hypothetical protein n=1 Tax=Photorhabdus heterorhabditis TaxID=880156 RepID=UPI0015621D7A|nr:hypothetical protein [Photorhabdus heterorhabditis]NRN28036.1 hypothetical protein [Photorhabdus heterorhabditis subsp. aluminescens]
MAYSLPCLIHLSAMLSFAYLRLLWLFKNANTERLKLYIKGGFNSVNIPVIFQVASLLAALTPVTELLYPSSFKLLLCWLRSLTPVIELSMLLGMRSLAAALQLEVYWV